MLFAKPTRFEVILVSDLGAYSYLHKTNSLTKVNYPGLLVATSGIHLYLSKKSPVFKDRVLVEKFKEAIATLYSKDTGQKIIDKYLGGSEWRE